MTRWISVGLITLTLGASESSDAARRASPFPLVDGNRWTLRDVNTNAPRTIAVRRGDAGLVLSGLPGMPDVRVRWSGRTLQAWDRGNRRWEALFRFGAAAGETYTVDLSETLLWRRLVVTVASKRAAVEDLTGRTRRGCIRFTFRARKPVADAAIEAMAFAPGVGPVHVAEQTIAGERHLALAGYRVRK